MEEKIIDGVKVEECSYYNKDNTPYCCEVWDNECEAQNCYYKQLKRLEEENEKIKKQYNCYACGNCKGTEDYINLEKHHKGLRKQFDILVKRNNELSLRIEQLEQENEELKQKYEKIYEHQGEVVKAYSLNKNKLSLYKHALEEIKAELKEYLTCESRECGCDDYGECLKCLKETILNIITEVIGE